MYNDVDMDRYWQIVDDGADPEEAFLSLLDTPPDFNLSPWSVYLAHNAWAGGEIAMRCPTALEIEYAIDTYRQARGDIHELWINPKCSFSSPNHRFLIVRSQSVLLWEIRIR